MFTMRSLEVIARRGGPRASRRPRDERRQPAAGRRAGREPGVAVVPAPRAIPAAPKFVFPEANTEIRDKVVSTVAQNPDSAARLVKSWIKDG